MDATGSKTNQEDFVLLQEDINGMKARVCQTFSFTICVPILSLITPTILAASVALLCHYANFSLK